jgi:phosphate starvation-inducible membrane PsiE
MNRGNKNRRNKIQNSWYIYSVYFEIIGLILSKYFEKSKHALFSLVEFIDLQKDETVK